MEHAGACTGPEQTEMKNEIVDIMIPLMMDARMDFIQDLASKTVVKLLGDSENEALQLKEHLFVLGHTYSLILDYTKNNGQEEGMNVQISERILNQCVAYWEQLLDKPVGCSALDQFFSAPDTDR